MDCADVCQHLHGDRQGYFVHLVFVHGLNENRLRMAFAGFVNVRFSGLRKAFCGYKQAVPLYAVSVFVDEVGSHGVMCFLVMRLCHSAKSFTSSSLRAMALPRSPRGPIFVRIQVPSAWRFTSVSLPISEVESIIGFMAFSGYGSLYVYKIRTKKVNVKGFTKNSRKPQGAFHTAYAVLTRQAGFAAVKPVRIPYHGQAPCGVVMQ